MSFFRICLFGCEDMAVDAICISFCQFSSEISKTLGLGLGLGLYINSRSQGVSASKVVHILVSGVSQSQSWSRKWYQLLKFSVSFLKAETDFQKSHSRSRELRLLFKDISPSRSLRLSIISLGIGLAY